MDKIEIIRIDKKHRIVIPPSLLEVLDIQEKENPKVLAIWSKEKQEIRIKKLNIENIPPNTATFYLESEVLPERYQKNIEGFIETIWDRKSDLKKGKKIKILKIDDGIEITVPTSRMEKGGRIGLPKLLRSDLNLKKGSYLMAVPKLSKRSVILKKSIAFQIKKKNTLEWRVVSPIPEDINIYIKNLNAEEVKVFGIGLDPDEK